MTAPEASILTAIIGAFVTATAVYFTWVAGRRQRLADFRAAAIERRLETHQEAYRLWHEMVSALNDPKKKGPECALRCQDWWISNCLYLDAKVREEFIACSREAFLYPDLKLPDKPHETKTRFNRIQRVFDLLAEGVQLPSIGEFEGWRNEIKRV